MSIRLPMQSVKTRLARGETASMVLVDYASPALVEHLGQLGFDIAFIDTEKGSATPERIEEMCRGARAAGIAAVVRPWSADPGLISRYLDLGADGIMLAGVEKVEQAQTLVAAVRYARHQDWASKLVIAILESPTALANLPQLLQVEGVDVWFIGPNDLAHRMGWPGESHRPEVQAAIRQALSTIAAAGRVGGTLATPRTIAAARAAGARLLLTRSRELLAHGASEFLEGLRNAGEDR